MRTYSGIVENGDEFVTADVIEDWAYDDGWEIDDLYAITQGGDVDFEFVANPPGNFDRGMQEASLGILAIQIERAHRKLEGIDTYVQWTNLG